MWKGMTAEVDDNLVEVVNSCWILQPFHFRRAVKRKCRYEYCFQNFGCLLKPPASKQLLQGCSIKSIIKPQPMNTWVKKNNMCISAGSRFLSNVKQAPYFQMFTDHVIIPFFPLCEATKGIYKLQHRYAHNQFWTKRRKRRVINTFVGSLQIIPA